MALTKIQTNLSHNLGVSALDYGAKGDGTTDDTTAIQNAVDALPTGGTLYLPRGTYKITSSITILKSISIQGEGSQTDEGTKISNITNNVSAFVVGNDTVRADRVWFRDLYILNHSQQIGSTSSITGGWGIHFRNSPYSGCDNVYVNCASLGYGGILFGTQLEGSDSKPVQETDGSKSYLGTLQNCRINNHQKYGVRVNSRGSTWNFNYTHCSSGYTGAIGGRFESKFVHVDGGQWGGGDNDQNIGIQFYAYSALYGGTVKNIRVENVADAGIFCEVTGDDAKCHNITIENVGCQDFTSVTGTLIKFTRSHNCLVNLPYVDDPGTWQANTAYSEGTIKRRATGTQAGYFFKVISGGTTHSTTEPTWPTTDGGTVVDGCVTWEASKALTIVDWGEFSTDSVLNADTEVARKDCIVHASATRPVKNVVGVVSRTEAERITTYTNLKVVIPNGVDQLPSGFIPTHNGVAWNYAHFTSLGDDQVETFTPPTTMGICRVLNDDEADTFGIFSYDARTTAGEVYILAGAGAFQVWHGGTSNRALAGNYDTADLSDHPFGGAGVALAGTTGTNLFLNVSCYDNKIYIEARKGTSNVTLLIENAVYGV